MRFKIDENLPVEVAQLLVAAGHDALTVLDQNLRGHPDPDIASVCKGELRTLLTLVLDFADIRNYPPEDYFGIICLRSRLQDKISVINLVTRLIPMLATEPIEKYLWIVDESSIRIRSGPLP